MQVIRGIPSPLPGERPLEVVPPLAPYVRPKANADQLRRHLNLFPQRALTHVALTQEQRARIIDTALLAQAVAPGVIDGFEVALEVGRTKTNLLISPGHALTNEGLDIELVYPLRVQPDDIAVHGETLRGWAREGDDDDVIAKITSTSGLEIKLGELINTDKDGIRTEKRAGLLPHAMVLVAQPVTVAVGSAPEAVAVCDNATGDTVTPDLAWEDGFRLVWVPWPADRPLPLWSEDGEALESRFRNRLAYAIFDDERRPAEYDGVRSVGRMTEMRSPDGPRAPRRPGDPPLPPLQQPWPWEAVGVALSIVGFDGKFRPAFADRAAVVRQGGGRRNRTPLVHLAGEDVLWQARVAQMLEHVAELPVEERSAYRLVAHFERLPPAGLLPRDAVDIEAKRQMFFPPQFDVQAQPVPLDMIDALMAESASLASLDLSGTEQVQVLVPVPARFYEKDLLNLDERINPLFDLEIRRLEDERLRLLKRRDALRRRIDLLTKAISGGLPAYPEDDPNALADERGALDAMAFSRIRRVEFDSTIPLGEWHFHGFKRADARLTMTAADTMFMYVNVNRPVLALALRVERQVLDTTTTPPTPITQEAIFFWGTVAQLASTMIRVGDLPVGEDGKPLTNTWMRLDLPVALGARRTSARVMPNLLLDGPLDNMQFGVLPAEGGGAVRWGYAGVAGTGTEAYWVADAFPPGSTPTVSGGAPVLWDGLGEVIAPWEEAGFGVVTKDATRFSVQELDTLIERYSNTPGGLGRELGVPWARPAWSREGDAGYATRDKGEPLTFKLPPLIEQGLTALIARLEQRIAAGDDHIEVGFLRARTDIFRLRQGVLGTTLAGRLLTSPAAAELVQRSESAVATDKVFADYFERAKTRTQPPTP
jgi:hypothetical protein